MSLTPEAEAEFNRRVHKAVPAEEETEIGVISCGICGVPIKRVSGGQGPTWVHADTGAVAGKTTVLAAVQQDKEKK